MGDYGKLIDMIRDADNIVFFGGAGVSTESGIPDFRGNNGLYTTSKEDAPEEKLHCRYLLRHPAEFTEYYRSHMLYPDARPNPLHRFLARLEEKGKLSAVITQNIDGLHQMAGSKNVIELHGSVLRNHCMRCGKKYGVEKIRDTCGLPLCACGGIVRPDVVLYGEPLDGENWGRAEDAIANADLLIVGGTSLTVQPAASLILGFCGKHLVMINRSSTPYDGMADEIIRDPIGAVFAAVSEEMGDF